MTSSPASAPGRCMDGTAVGNATAAGKARHGMKDIRVAKRYAAALFGVA